MRDCVVLRAQRRVRWHDNLSIMNEGTGIMVAHHGSSSNGSSFLVVLISVDNIMASISPALLLVYSP
jgi:hypothetical protein